MAWPRIDDIFARHSWTSGQFRKTLKQLGKERLITVDTKNRLQLTTHGLLSAKSVVRKHRLWEAYLISHADVATGMVDLSADRIEHVLDEHIIHELEQLFPNIRGLEPPESPHDLPAAGGAI